MRFIAKDGKTHYFGSAKAARLHHQRIKPVKLTWTQAWRRMNKKGKTEEGKSRKGRRAAKFQKAIVGMSLEDIKRKRAQKPELRAAATEAAKKEAKDRIAKKGTSGAKPKAPAAAKPAAKKAADKGKKADAPKTAGAVKPPQKGKR